MEPSKPIWFSKTFWANAILAVVAAVTGLMGAEWIADNPGLTSLLGSAVGVLNIVLRYITTTAVNMTGETYVPRR